VRLVFIKNKSVTMDGNVSVKTAVWRGVGGKHILTTTNLLDMTSKVRNAAMFVSYNL
jgi:hypothetical protein